MELLRSFRPDVMVLDLMLPGLDGITLLQSAAKENFKPIVLAVTRFSSQYVIDAAARLGVGYLMMKPCESKSAYNRLMELTEQLEPPLFAQPDQRALITNLLLSLGVPTKRMGYGFLREAVVRMIHDPRQSMMKELYPSVAKLFNATTMQVERDIRGAIEAAWLHRDNLSWQQLFPPKTDGPNTRPTNATFISRLADSIISNQYGIQEEQRYLG